MSLDFILFRFRFVFGVAKTGLQAISICNAFPNHTNLCQTKVSKPA
jgi:hypothetical protein